VNQALILSGPDIPKYGEGLLQKANSLGSATYGDHIADVSPVFELFVQQNSELSYPDWVDFYQETRDAEKELTGATNLLRKYMTRLETQLMEFSKMNCVGNGRRDMVYRRSFQGFTREREIADHFRRKYGFDCRVTSTHREESKGLICILELNRYPSNQRRASLPKQTMSMTESRLSITRTNSIR